MQRHMQDNGSIELAGPGAKSNTKSFSKVTLGTVAGIKLHRHRAQYEKKLALRK